MRRLLATITALTLSFAAPPAFADVHPVSVDTTMEELLGGDRSDLLLAPDALDLSKLDYSLKSLKDIDAWLEAVHAVNATEAAEGKAGKSLTQDGRGRNTVTLAGLYLGETVRRNSDLGWSWTTFDELIAENPAYAEHFGTEAGLDTYVLVGRQGVATPINSALKRVINGRVDSLAYVGEFLSRPVEIDKAIDGYDPGPEPKVVSREMDEAEAEASAEEAGEQVGALIEAIEAAKAELKAPSQ